MKQTKNKIEHEIVKSQISRTSREKRNLQKLKEIVEQKEREEQKEHKEKKARHNYLTSECPPPMHMASRRSRA